MRIWKLKISQSELGAPGTHCKPPHQQWLHHACTLFCGAWMQPQNPSQHMIQPSVPEIGYPRSTVTEFHGFNSVWQPMRHLWLWQEAQRVACRHQGGSKGVWVLKGEGVVARGARWRAFQAAGTLPEGMWFHLERQNDCTGALLIKIPKFPAAERGRVSKPLTIHLIAQTWNHAYLINIPLKSPFRHRFRGSLNQSI